MCRKNGVCMFALENLFDGFFFFFFLKLCFLLFRICCMLCTYRHDEHCKVVFDTMECNGE